MEMLIVTRDADRWSVFANALTQAGHTVSFAPNAHDAVIAAQTRTLSLVLWDAIDTDATLRDDSVRIMMVDVRIHQCAATTRTHEEFHHLTEGLGFLPEVSSGLSAADALKLLSSLRAVEGM